MISIIINDIQNVSFFSEELSFSLATGHWASQLVIIIRHWKLWPDFWEIMTLAQKINISLTEISENSN